MTDVNALTQGIETPATLIELHKLEANLTSMQRLAEANGVVLRPHAKTHKSIEIGSRQLALGASGLTVATIDEAVVFARDAKAGSITISRPIVSETKLDRLFAELGGADVDLRLVVDSQNGVAAASEAAARASTQPGVFIKATSACTAAASIPVVRRRSTSPARLTARPISNSEGCFHTPGRCTR